MTKIILGSSSPRRAEILNYFSLPFDIAKSDFNEDEIPFRGNPLDYVKDLALAKLHSLHDKFKESIIVTADTTVYREGKIYNKPKSENEAFQAILELQGTYHSVFTGIALYDGRNETPYFYEVEETKVLFNPLTDEEILKYLSKIGWADKASGYAIQMAGGLIVNRIEGCYYNVMGLPINALRKILKRANIELWDYIK